MTDTHASTPTNNTLPLATLAAVCFFMLACTTLSGCFTGVESTPRITEKDVQRAKAGETNPAQQLLKTYDNSFGSWQEGKRFLVSDSSAAVLFDNPPAKMHGLVITYAGSHTRRDFAGRDCVVITFLCHGQAISLNTGKTRQELDKGFDMPALIDLDMVEHYNELLSNATLWVLSPLWNGYHGPQRKFIAVTVDSVTPGDKVAPMKVHFTPKGSNTHAHMMIAKPGGSNSRHNFENFFSATDPRLEHQEIGNEAWSLITQCQVAEGMTKAECRLALGAPDSALQVPDQNGLTDIWRYRDGKVLTFTDGKLTTIKN